MKRFALLTVALLGLQAAACDKQEIDNIPFEVFDLSSNSDMATFVVPGVPFIGTQIDRMGRPAVNAALTHPFGLPKQTKTSDQVKNDYNAATQQAWDTFRPQPYIASSLAVYDALDGTCGNPGGTMGTALGLYTAPASATSYDKLAKILADDRLNLNTSLGRCTSFLAVELASTTDCGGRTPVMDVIDSLYTFLSGSTTVVTDGVVSDPDGVPSPPSVSSFPFLLAPK